MHWWGNYEKLSINILILQILSQIMMDVIKFFRWKKTVVDFQRRCYRGFL
ncbi:MAG: hypothetical protein ACD_78C00102G0002 [uncultured bacterium (gcode 4)]|uniref:Uncharacterized protein n=1 Tax=uncultured bacterium (gcode 4) TaxID=1234023 RepID=K1YDF9_9BACT|nr:MAG: hypothetical protein ACD_78C00102G0002 [uncultured bacterium (gcode 4)]